MTNVTNYRIYCETESDWVEGWGASEPTTCYNDTAHTVNANSVQDLQTVSDSLVIVQEESISTGGNLQLESYTFDVPSSGTTGEITTFGITYPIPVNLLSFTVCPTDKNIGDCVSADVGYHTTIGAITENVDMGVSGGITGFGVSQTVMDYLNLGYQVTLTNGVTSCEMGRCIMKDVVNNKISTEFSSITDFSVASPTYVQQTVEMVRNLYFPYSTVPLHLGDDKIGASYIPANTVGRVHYTNNDGMAKKFTFYIEHLY